MKTTVEKKGPPIWLCAVAVIALAIFGFAYFSGWLKREGTIVMGIVMAVMFARGDIKRLWNWPSVLLLGYIAYTAISAFWAISGKFFLNGYVKLFPAALIFVALVMYGRSDKAFARRVIAVIADLSAIYAFMSVEITSTGLNWLLFRWLEVEDLRTGFGTRLYGIFGNSNNEASIFAIGILFAFALLSSAEGKRERAFRAAELAFSTFAFVLLLSLGAMVCFAIALIVYLIVAREGRGSLLLRMVEGIVPSTALAFAASRFFNVPGREALPLVLMLLDAVVVAAVELYAAGRLGAALDAHQKAVFGALLGVVALAAVYMAVAMHLGAPYTFGQSISRGAALAPGEHTLAIEADGAVEVQITSQSRVQTLIAERTIVYEGDASGARFVVPEESAGCMLTFSAPEGVTLRSASIDGSRLVLRYRLLPEFAASRLQGTLMTNGSVVTRIDLWRSGLRFFAFNPVFGNGLGSFETGLSRVMNYDYETKYVHNHYIQILLEGGVIAFVLFFGSLAAMAAALWKKRSAMRSGEFALIYPVFVAEFVMNGLQMLWDISMTQVIFLCMTYAFYALIVLDCAEPIERKRADTEQEDAEKKPKKKQAQKPGHMGEIRLACMLLPVFVAVTFIGNYISLNLINSSVPTLEQYLDDLETAGKIDLYEYGDAWLSYATQVRMSGAVDYLDKANEYAERLSKLKSNSIHMFLTEYYLNTQQFEKAVEMPLLSAVYAASDTDMWNSVTDMLRQAFTAPGLFSPLLTEGDVLLPKLVEYHDMLLARNRVALKPVELTDTNAAFFDEIVALAACNGDTVEMAKILSA